MGQGEQGGQQERGGGNGNGRMQREWGTQLSRGQWEGVVVGAMGSLNGTERGEGGRGRYKEREAGKAGGCLRERSDRLAASEASLAVACERSEASVTASI